MGIGSSLLQFVESLRENRPLPPDPPPAPDVFADAPPVRDPDPLDEVAVAVRASRQRLEVLAERLSDLKAKVGGGPVPGGPAPTR